MRMKKVFGLIVTVLIVAVMFTLVSGTDGVFAADVPVFSLKVHSILSNGEYIVSLYVENAQDIYGFEASVSFDSGITEFLPSGSKAAHDGISVNPKIEGTRFRVAFSKLGKVSPIKGSTDLYYFRLKAINEGATGLVLESIKVVDSAGNAREYKPCSEFFVQYIAAGGKANELIVVPDTVPMGGPLLGNILDISGMVQVSAREDGVSVTTVSEDLLEEIDEELDNEQSVFIRVEDGSKGQVLTTPAELFTILSEKKGSLILDYGNLQLRLPGNAIDMERILNRHSINNPSELQVNVEVREIQPPDSITGIDASIVGRVFEISMEIVSQDGKITEVGSFAVPVELWIPETGGDDGHVKGTRNVYKIDANPPKYCVTAFNNGYYRAELNGFSQYAVLEYEGTFSDVAPGHWAKDYIRVLAAKFIVAGVGNNRFEPGRTVTRAEFAKMLVEALNLKKEEYAGTFSDVSKEAWYAPYAESAVRAGITKGVGNRKFDPNGTITREQMAVMVMNAYTYAKGTKVSESAAKYDGNLTDLESASSWAIEGIRAAYAEGIINGMSDGTFMPLGFSDRSQAAAVIVRLLNILGKL